MLAMTNRWLLCHWEGYSWHPSEESQESQWWWRDRSLCWVGSMYARYKEYCESSLYIIVSPWCVWIETIKGSWAAGQELHGVHNHRVLQYALLQWCSHLCMVHWSGEGFLLHMLRLNMIMLLWGVVKIEEVSPPAAERDMICQQIDSHLLLQS